MTLFATGDARDSAGGRLVGRNGRAQYRTVTCGAGTLQVRAFRMNDRSVDDEGGPAAVHQSHGGAVYALFAAGARSAAGVVSGRRVDR